MTLIKSISGIRGTIGGRAGDSFSPADIVKYTSAYGEWIRMNSKKERIKVMVGRDARISGGMVNNLVTSSLVALGIDVVDIGLAATPTVEIAVTELEADGGIIISASHNPKQWNALKLLNSIFYTCKIRAKLRASLNRLKSANGRLFPAPPPGGRYCQSGIFSAKSTKSTNSSFVGCSGRKKLIC